MTQPPDTSDEMTGLELSPRKVSYLKFLLAKDDTVRTTEISEAFEVDPSTVTKLIAELAEDGYLDHIPYRGVRLTESGRQYAEFCLKRHQILGLMFSHYGLTSTEACDETSRIETFVSKKAVDRICSSMGHPSVSYCGKPGEARQIRHDSCLHGAPPNLIKKL